MSWAHSEGALQLSRCARKAMPELSLEPTSMGWVLPSAVHANLSVQPALEAHLNGWAAG
jgi:hypothetical protein